MISSNPNAAGFLHKNERPRENAPPRSGEFEIYEISNLTGLYQKDDVLVMTSPTL